MAILAPFFIISSRIILSDSIVLKLEDDLLNGCDGLHSLLHINFRKVRALILGNTLHLKKVSIAYFFIPTFIAEELTLLRHLVGAFLLFTFEGWVIILAPIILVIVFQVQSETALSLGFFKLWLFIALWTYRHANISLIESRLCSCQLQHQLSNDIFHFIEEACNIDSKQVHRQEE